MAVPQGERCTGNRLRGCHSTVKASTWSNYLIDWRPSYADYEPAAPDSVDHLDVILNSEIVDEQTDFLDAEEFQDFDLRIAVPDQRWDHLHYNQSDVAGMMAEELAHSAVGIEVEVEVGTDTGSAAGMMTEVGRTEPGSRRWGNSCHLDRRMDSESGHRYIRWRLDHQGRRSEGS